MMTGYWAGMSGDTAYKLPQHIAIIMDGNGRWATRRGLPRTAGHKKGADAVRRTVRACGELGIRYLTLYAFSSENWKRPESEVTDLMGLLRLYLRKELADLHKNNVRVRVIGDRKRLADDIRDLIENAEQTTAKNTGLTLAIALSYGGRHEIAVAAQVLAQRVAEGLIRPEDITEDMLGSAMDSADIPDPDIILRTAGEQRLSNFLLWQSAYTEFVYTSDFWPDFGKDHIIQAIEEFNGRERRYGGLGVG